MEMIVEFHRVNIFVKKYTYKQCRAKLGRAGLEYNEIGPGGPEQYLARYGPGRAIKKWPDFEACFLLSFVLIPSTEGRVIWKKLKPVCLLVCLCRVKRTSILATTRC